MVLYQETTSFVSHTGGFSGRKRLDYAIYNNAGVIAEKNLFS
jgi:hypothetical protein